MREILGVRDGQGWVGAQGAAVIASADFHGAEMCVVRARCVSRVGLRGIVVRDTKFTFEVVTPGDEIKIVPKEHSVFGIEVPMAEADEMLMDGDREKARRLVFEVHGEQIQNRAPERANKKFRMHVPPEL